MKNSLSGEDTNEKSTFGSKMKQLKTIFLGNDGMKNTKKEKNQLSQKSINVKNKNVNKTKENILHTILMNKNQNYVIFLAEIF
jgi:hypothetical protein